MGDIILVAGISGVGKTKLCRRLLEIYPAARHLIASSFVAGGEDENVVREIAAAGDQAGAAAI